MTQLDRLDAAILGALEKDARQPVTALARRLNSPVSTIRDRIQRLEQAGVIRGYTVVVDQEKLGFPVKAIIRVTRDQQVPVEAIVEQVSSFPEVACIQLLTGETDELLTIYVRSVEHLRDFLYEQIPKIPGLQRTNTVIVLVEIALPHLERALAQWDQEPEPSSP
jgi:DNA-binding Lrp family transcriptional regulator